MKGKLPVILAILMTLALALPVVAAAGEQVAQSEVDQARRTAQDWVHEARSEVISEANVVGRFELRTLADPLTREEMKAIRAEVRAKATAKGFLDDAVGGIKVECVGEFKIPGKGWMPIEAVVAYGIVIGSDGVPSTLLVRAHMPEEYVRKGYGLTIPQSALEWFEEEVRERRDTAITVPSPATGVWWQRTGDWHHYIQVEPFGHVQNHVQLYRLRNDGCSTYERYAVRQRVVVEPGITVAGWHSDWRTRLARARQDWGWGTIEHLLEDWDPLLPSHNVVAGDVTVHKLPPPGWVEIAVTLAAGIADLILDWEFYQPPETSIWPDPSLVGRYGFWEKCYTQDTWASKHTTCMEPGTVIIVHQQPPGLYPLIEVTASGQFRDPHWHGGAWYRYLRHILSVYARF